MPSMVYLHALHEGSPRSCATCSSFREGWECERLRSTEMVWRQYRSPLPGPRKACFGRQGCTPTRLLQMYFETSICCMLDGLLLRSTTGILMFWRAVDCRHLASRRLIDASVMPSDWMSASANWVSVAIFVDELLSVVVTSGQAASCMKYYYCRATCTCL
jgi:hypothetical protein